MRKMMNKKGFSLVELMIVVVIMGILVAVAIPLYSALTDKARTNVCRNNQDTVRTSFAKWVLMDAEHNANTLFSTSTKSFNGKTQDAETILADDFLACFEEGVLPSCPEEGHYYIISRATDETINVKCVADDGTIEEDHSEEETTEQP